MFVFAQIAYFLVVLLVINAPTKKDPGHAPALLGPSRCAMLGSGALWPSGLRRGHLHMLLSAGFVFASLLHMIVAVITLARYGLPFEAKRGWRALSLTFFTASAIGALSAGATLPNSVLAAGSSAPLAFMGDELVTVVWSGGFSMFGGGSHQKRALPCYWYWLAFWDRTWQSSCFSGGAISFWACLASFSFGMLISMTAPPGKSSKKARIDDGQGTGDAWAWWKKNGYIIATFVSVLFGVAAIVGFEQTVIPDKPAPC